MEYTQKLQEILKNKFAFVECEIIDGNKIKIRLDNRDCSKTYFIEKELDTSRTPESLAREIMHDLGVLNHNAQFAVIPFHANI